MGDSSLLCHPAPEGCCLELHETVAVLLALILVVQLALKLTTVICYYICCFVGGLCRALTAKGSEKPPVLVRPVKKAHHRKPPIQYSEEDLPRRRHRRSRSPQRRCLQCTLEPVKLTMNLEGGHFRCREHQQMRRRSCADYPPCGSPRYYSCDCENRHRARTSSAPSAYPIPHYRDVACGTSDLIVNVPADAERRNVGIATEPYPRTPVAETQRRSMVTGQDADYPPAGQHSRRPARVYIYPVHPQTPPGSRSPSPERAHRRRAVSQDEQADYEAREQRHRAREPEALAPATPQQQVATGGPPRFHNVVSSIMQTGATPAEPGGANTKQRQPRAETPPGSDWVYRPLK
ncbi:uncharacterized protein LOC112542430 [Python bivittatus]|uniref:Uncharacterized protein LOC112542430 n=1 Tax=Python bivittatus TaxID=176946 RepID=A0A9F5JAQ2_PYTBI|nr:uncharacterized protein LOC112542430 [Python bivittatus]